MTEEKKNYPSFDKLSLLKVQCVWPCGGRTHPSQGRARVVGGSAAATAVGEDKGATITTTTGLALSEDTDLRSIQRVEKCYYDVVLFRSPLLSLSPSVIFGQKLAWQQKCLIKRDLFSVILRRKKVLFRYFLRINFNNLMNRIFYMFCFRFRQYLFDLIASEWWS